MEAGVINGFLLFKRVFIQSEGNSLNRIRAWLLRCLRPLPVGWDCRIRWLHLSRGVRLASHPKLYDIEALVLELEWMLSTFSLSLLLGSLWSGVVVPISLLNGSKRTGPAVRVLANGPGDLGSIPGRVIPKTLKMELDTTLLNTQHYKVRFKGKVEQSWEWSSALPYTLV